MQIKNGLVYTKDCIFEKKDLYVTEDRFAETSDSDGQEIDAKDCYVIPGLIDIHFHGCMGADFCDGTLDALHTIAQYEGVHGVTSIVPATMTCSEEKLTQIACVTKDFMEEQAVNHDKMATVYGMNMEGPFLSGERCGAQNPSDIIKPDYELFNRINRLSNGAVRLLSIAPETEGAMEFIKKAGTQTRVSIAHTACDYETATEAFGAGAKHVTHLYNAMPMLHHRQPGPIAAAVENEDVTPELICDGVHVAPAMVRMAFQMFGKERIILISDSMRATGMVDGTYDLGGQMVSVQGKKATLGDGTLAGSVTNLMDCMIYAVKQMGISLEYAIRCASENPAKALGLYHEIGSIEDGKKADFVILNKSDLSIKHVVIRGQIL